MSHHIKWERFINVHGGPGRNIPCDLFNEHMNKLFKDIIAHMGANVTEKTVQRAARSVTTLTKVMQVFDKQTGISVQNKAHADRQDDNDVSKVADVLIKENLLEIKPGRKLSQFPGFDPNPLSGLDWAQMETWIGRKKKELLTFNYAIEEGALSASDTSDGECPADSDDSNSPA